VKVDMPNRFPQRGFPMPKKITATNFELVQAFHKAIGNVPIPDHPSVPGPARAALRANLMEEEYTELVEAMAEGNVEHVAKELADLLYVVYGTADEYGIPMDKVFAEVHRSNMTKLIDGFFRADGKYQKGPSYEPANLAPILAGSTR